MSDRPKLYNPTHQSVHLPHTDDHDTPAVNTSALIFRADGFPYYRDSDRIDHPIIPAFPGDVTKFLDGTGEFSVPTGGGGGGGGAFFPPGVYAAPPVASAWTQVNFLTGATLTDVTTEVGSSVMLHSVAHGPTNSQEIAVKSAPVSTPYSVVMAFRTMFYYNGTNSYYAGLVFRESASGKLINLDYQSSGAVLALRVLKWNSPSSFNSNILAGTPDFGGWTTPFLMLKMTDNGTDLLFYVSSNLGFNWVQVASIARGAFFTTTGYPDQIGFHNDAGATGTQDEDTVVYSWKTF